MDKHNITKEFDTCSFCEADLTKGNLMYVELGCSNYIYYKRGENGTWEVEAEDDGQNPVNSFYACKTCNTQLPDNFQEYFENTV